MVGRTLFFDSSVTYSILWGNPSTVDIVLVDLVNPLTFLSAVSQTLSSRVGKEKSCLRILSSMVP